MKLLIITSLLLIVNFCFGQTTYESPYVVDGQSFKMTIPKVFPFSIKPDNGMMLYAVDPEFSFESETPSSDCLMIYLMPNEDEVTLEDAMKEAMNENPEGMENIEKYTTSNGNEFILGAADLGLGIEGVELSDFCVTLFDDVLLMVMYLDLEDDYSNPKLIKSIANSYSVYETNRENELFFYSEDSEYLEDYEELPNFKNSLFDTRLTYEEVFFDPWNELDDDTDWYEDFDEDYLELLSAYEFIDYDQENPQTQGGIKFFSGGFADNFKREVDQLEALKHVFPDYAISEIKFEKEVQGDEFKFKKYKITSLSKSNNAFAYYSTTYQGELLFFMVYEEWQPSDQFRNEFEDVIKTFFIIENE